MRACTPWLACARAGANPRSGKKPLSFWLGRNWVEVTVLAGSVLLVMIVELLNTGIETVVDRIGPEWHALSKRAKDMGSAAVLLSLLIAGGAWLAALYTHFFAL